LCWTDVEVTCDVRSVVYWSHAESLRNVVVEEKSSVDEVAITFINSLTARHTETVKPQYT